MHLYIGLWYTGWEGIRSWALVASETPISATKPLRIYRISEGVDNEGNSSGSWTLKHEERTLQTDELLIGCIRLTKTRSSTSAPGKRDSSKPERESARSSTPTLLNVAGASLSNSSSTSLSNVGIESLPLNEFDDFIRQFPAEPVWDQDLGVSSCVRNSNWSSAKWVIRCLDALLEAGLVTGLKMERFYERVGMRGMQLENGLVPVVGGVPVVDL